MADENEIEFEEEVEEEEEYVTEDDEISDYYEEDDIEDEKEEAIGEVEEEEEEERSFEDYNVSLAITIGRIKKNVLLMLQDRDIDIKDEKNFLQLKHLDIFCKCIQNKKNFFSNEYIKNNKKILVHFIIKSNKKKVCLNEIKEVFEKNKYSNYLIIIPEKLSFDANLEIQKYKNVEIFSYDYFLFSLPRHVYVPKHILLSEKQKEIFLKIRKIDILQLPIIKSTDPIIKYYGWERGNIVQIQRPGWTVYRSIF